MQPTPLTGTATGTPGPQTPVHLQDAAHTPHGDGNASSWSLCTWVYTMQPTPLTGTATGRVGLLWGGVLPGMQPTPLTGTATELSKGRNASTEDAAHTPHGDGNTASLCRVWTAVYDAAHTPHGDGNLSMMTHRAAFSPKMQPTPLTGTAAAMRAGASIKAGEKIPHE